MGVHNYRADNAYRARSTAAEWRRDKLPGVLGEREDRRAIFQGLEEIDNIIAGEKIRPDDSRDRSQSLTNQPRCSDMKGPRTHGGHCQRAAVERMHNGLHSVGEMDSISDQIQQLTTLPRLPHAPASPPTSRSPHAPASPPTSRSPPFTARAKKYRRISETSISEPVDTDLSSLPEIQGCSASGLVSQSLNVSPPQSSNGSAPRSSMSLSSPSVSPPQSRRSSISDPSDLCSHLSSQQTARPHRRFPCHEDLFATVLTPRSRSKLPRLHTASDRSVGSSRSLSPRQSSPLQSPMQTSVDRRPSLGGESFMLVDEGCPGVLPPRNKVGPRELEHAYKSLRLLIFGKGTPGNTRDKLQTFCDEIGTKKQHIELFDFWSQLDPNMFGEVKFSDFQSLLGRLEKETNAHQLQSRRITSLLLNRETGDVELDDVIEALWPELGPDEVAKIWEHMGQEQEKRRRIEVNEPPLLAAEEREALERIFEDIDTGKTGHVSFETLAAAKDECGLPIMDQDRLNHYAAEWDIWWGPLGSENVAVQEEQESNSRPTSRERRRSSVGGGEDVITLNSFLQMMCPAGFRAFEGAKVTTHETGGVLIRSNSGTWHAL